MVSQILYGEHFKVLEYRKFWSKIRIAFDGCEGWVINHNIKFIEQDTFNTLEQAKDPLYSSELVSFVETEESILLAIVLESSPQKRFLVIAQV